MDREVRWRFNEIRSCYNTGLRQDGDLRGSIDLALACRPNASQAVASKQLEAAGVRRCVERSSRAWLSADSFEGTALARVELRFAPTRGPPVASARWDRPHNGSPRPVRSVRWVPSPSGVRSAEHADPPLREARSNSVSSGRDWAAINGR